MTPIVNTIMSQVLNRDADPWSDKDIIHPVIYLLMHMGLPVEYGFYVKNKKPYKVYSIGLAKTMLNSNTAKKDLPPSSVKIIEDFKTIYRKHKNSYRIYDIETTLNAIAFAFYEINSSQKNSVSDDIIMQRLDNAGYVDADDNSLVIIAARELSSY